MEEERNYKSHGDGFLFNKDNFKVTSLAIAYTVALFGEA